jgi:hypothetical protein
MIRLVRELVCFLDGQGVQVSPKTNGPVASALCQGAHNTRTGNTGFDLKAELPEFVSHEFCGSVFFKCDFGMRMYIASPRGHDVFVSG